MSDAAIVGSGASAGWRGFLRALADEIDSVGGTVARDALLYGVGERMALMQPLPAAVDISGLELEMNARLADWGWGVVRLELNDSERALFISLHGLPTIGSVGDPPGTWLSAVLEGLFTGWLGQLPGADRGLRARRQRMTQGAVVLRYARNA